jgi:Immunity protein Imm1
MYVKRIWIETGEGIEQEIIHPNWENIVLHLKMMNGNSKHMMFLYPDTSNESEESELLSVCGGENDTFICSLYNDGNETDLIDPDESSEEIVMFYAGQTSGKSKNQIVNFQMILIAVKTYVETGQLDMTLKWRNYDRDN